ncbi:MAG TPA: MerR family transcriptional regulator [Corynebacteriales bacterium]|nr:MerR family transcriptional regulator [Mycobacteriales bacterium]
MRLHGPDEPVYTIGVAARLLGVSPQTLRVIEREGLLEPHRTEANTRLYSENDLLLLQRIRSLVSEEGVNLAGVKLILEMESKIGNMRVKYRKIIEHTQGVPKDSDPDEDDDRS